MNLNVGARWNEDGKEATVFVAQYLGRLAANATLFDQNGVPPGFTLLAVQSNYTNARSFSNVSPRLGIDYNLTDQVMGYVSYSEGFKSGGFDMCGNAAANPATRNGYDAQTADNFEAGIKSTLLDNTLQLNLNVMLIGAALVTRAMLPAMRRRGYGRSVNIGSIHSVIASPFKSAYVAAKHGLLGFSKAVALETSDADITINTVCPSYVKTPLVDAQIDSLARTPNMTRDEVVEKIMLAPMPKRRFVEMSELIGSGEFLLSDAARNITGQCITIDGGWTAQ